MTGSGQPIVSGAGGTGTPTTPVEEGATPTEVGGPDAPDPTAGGEEGPVEVGLSEEQLEEGRIYVNGWSGETDEIPDGSNWTVKSVADQPGSEDAEEAEDEAGEGAGNEGNAGGANVTYDGKIKALLDANCTSCHAPGASRATSPMETYDKAKAIGDQIVARVAAGTMPTRGPLGAADKKAFDDWKAAGYPKGGAGGGNEEGNAGGNDGGGQVEGQGTNAVSFTIPNALVNGGWNARDNPVVVKVGGTLTVKNTTDKDYWIHTNGQPFPHPGQSIPPGQEATYQIRGAFDGAVRQHDGTPNQFQFYIRAEN